MVPSQPELTAMADLVFLLVAFFMISMSFTNVKALEAGLTPDDGCHIGPVSEHRDVEVFIDVNDQVWVENSLCQTNADISDAIELEMSRLATDSVVIEFNFDSLHGSTVRVVDAAKGVRVRTIQMKLGDCSASRMRQTS
jgi:biopolymer transport protein ExbD